MNVAQRNSTPLVEDGEVYHMGKWITCWFVWASITGSWLDPMVLTSFFFPVENKMFSVVLHLENTKYIDICNSVYTILHCFKSIPSTLFNILVVHWTLYTKLFLLLEPNCWRQSATSKRHCHLWQQGFQPQHCLPTLTYSYCNSIEELFTIYGKGKGQINAFYEFCV